MPLQDTKRAFLARLLLSIWRYELTQRHFATALRTGHNVKVRQTPLLVSWLSSYAQLPVIGQSSIADTVNIHPPDVLVRDLLPATTD